MRFGSVKKLWRFVLGASFIGSGLCYLGSTPMQAWTTIAIGGGFIVWHFVHRWAASRQGVAGEE